MKRKLLSFALALCICLSFIPAATLTASADPGVNVYWDAGIEFGSLNGNYYMYTYQIPGEPIGLLPVPVNKTFKNGTFNNMYFEGWETLDDPGTIIDETYIVPDHTLELRAVWTEGNTDMNFIDVKKSDWFYDSAKYCYSMNLINGTGSDTFSPNSNITRAMIVTILYRMNGSHKISDENPFVDVPDDTWYTDAVLWAAYYDIVAGDGEGLFMPNDNATREQLAQIMKNYSTFCGQYDPNSGIMLIGYPDSDDVSSWAGNAMAWAVGNGFVNGKPVDGTVYLDPKGNATRAEFATILLRHIKRFQGSLDYFSSDLFQITVPEKWAGNVICRYDNDADCLRFYAKKAYDAQDGRGGCLFWIKAVDPKENYLNNPNFHTLIGALMSYYDNTSIYYYVALFRPTDVQCPYSSKSAEGAQYNAMTQGYYQFNFDSNYFRFTTGSGR